jgi:hypothetical protein
MLTLTPEAPKSSFKIICLDSGRSKRKGKTYSHFLYNMIGLQTLRVNDVASVCLHKNEFNDTLSSME